MRYVPLVKPVLLFALAGSVGALMLGGGAHAQNITLMNPISQDAQNLSSADAPFTSNNGSNTNALNWAGYVATGGTYTSVSGSWIVPTVQTDSAENLGDTTWVGIGGVTNRDLIQAGTEVIPDSQGDLVYQTWYELLPEDSVAVPLSISPGDAVSVSITEAQNDVWEISFDDATTGKTYETDVQYDSSLSSADWVEEMPVEIGGIIGLDDFGTIDFTSGYAIKNGQPVTIRSSGATSLTMDNAQGTAVATPSSLAADGSSFTVSRTDAASSPLALSRDGISVVAAPSSPYAFASGGYSGYTAHIHRGRGGGYQIVIQF